MTPSCAVQRSLKCLLRAHSCPKTEDVFFKRFRPYLFVSWLLSWPILVLLWTTPIQFQALKMVLLGVVFFVVAVGALLFRPMRWVIFPSLTLVLAVAVWPSRPSSTQDLQTAYTNALLSYRNTPYVWGGETGRGIDCSGLIRRALMDALFEQGAKTANPSLIRHAAFLWWHDCSANEMKDGYRGNIARRFEAANLNSLDYAQLKPGDIAVTRNGVHILAYIGDKSWVQADPNLANGGDKVIVTQAPSKSGWFSQPMVICRWKWLEGGSKMK